MESRLELYKVINHRVVLDVTVERRWDLSENSHKDSELIGYVSNVTCPDPFVKFILLLFGHYLSVLDIPL